MVSAYCKMFGGEPKEQGCPMIEKDHPELVLESIDTEEILERMVIERYPE